MSTGSPDWSSIGQYQYFASSLTPPSRLAARRPMAGFDGKAEFDFAAGIVRGYRWWKLQAPDLTAPWGQWDPPLLAGSRDRPWGPGVNLAACIYCPAEHQPPVEYDPLTGPCGCGFWGYWDLRDHNLGPGPQLPVTGVIEGSGRTLIGELGFRCEKARIVALCPGFTVPGPAYPIGQDVHVHGATLTAGGLRTYQAITGHGHARIYSDAWMGVIQDRLMTMYPDAQVFTGKRAMLAMFPVTGAPGPAEPEAER